MKLRLRPSFAVCVTELLLLSTVSHGAVGNQGRADPRLPAFKVVAKDIPTAVCVLVPPDTTDEQLASLVNAFRIARARGTLGTMIPPTTPRAPRGPFAAVTVFVMSDPQWATDRHLHEFINPTTTAVSRQEREFGKRILAYYFYTELFSTHEEGSLGYTDEGVKYTKNYKRLF
jgi:hypothetical protein